METSCCSSEQAPKFLLVLAVGLEGVAVRAQGDHVPRDIGSLLGEVFDVVDLQDWQAGCGQLGGVACAFRAFAPAAAALDDGSSRTSLVLSRGGLSSG